MDDVCERLDDDDIYGDVMTRPVGELVALICRDLGLNPDWPSLAEEAWAKAEIESGDERSPFLERAAPERPLEDKSNHQAHQAHQERPELAAAQSAPS